MADRGHTPGEQEREWTIFVCPVVDCRGAVEAYDEPGDCHFVGAHEAAPGSQPLVEVVVVPKADDVTENYMVAVSRLKAERDAERAKAEKLADFIEENVEGAEVFRDTGMVVT